MGESMYKQSSSILYNPEKVLIPIIHCDYLLNISNVDLLCEDAVGFPHRHNTDFELYYMLEGTLEIAMDGKTVALSEYDCLCIAPGIAHHTMYDPKAKNRYFVMIFNFQWNGKSKENSHGNMSKKLMTILQNILEKKYCVALDRQNLQKYVEEMSHEVQHGELGWKSILHNYYVLFIFNVLRSLSTDNEEEHYHISYNTAARINKYLSEHYNEDINLQDMADILYYSPRHINRIFRQYFNSSLTKTLSRYRVNYAKSYLIESDYSIEKIAALVGYSSSNTLFKLFKEMEGMTPGQYREKYKANYDGTGGRPEE